MGNFPIFFIVFDSGSVHFNATNHNTEEQVKMCHKNNFVKTEMKAL